MPEAAIDKQSGSMDRKNEVRLAKQFGFSAPPGETCPSKKADHGQFSGAIS
jgi:hypothetical protein